MKQHNLEEGRCSPPLDNLGLPSHFSFPQGWRVLGKGQFGEVFLARYRPPEHTLPHLSPRSAAAAADDSDAEWVAVKLYSALDKLRLVELEYLRREVVCQRKLEHPHVISFREVGITTDMRLYLALEYADSGNLREWLDARGGRLQEPLARWFLQQLVYGLDYCHAHGVVNRDIKPANLLLHAAGMSPEMPLLKVADFGLCKNTHEAPPQTRVGSPFYMAPEVFSQRQYDGRKADVFSCGVVLYEMVFGVWPFTHKLGRNFRPNMGVLTAFYRDIDQELEPSTAASPPPAPSPTPGLMDLLRGMLRFDPAKRLSMHDIKLHAWYRQGLPPEVYDTLLRDPALHVSAGCYRARQSPELIETQFRHIMAHCAAMQEEASQRAADEIFAL